MLQALDIFFVLFHTALTVFNLIGWAHRLTRPANLITLLLTAGSWLFLGIFYGFGYCPLTDWHWQVLYALGEHDLPRSYITYLLERLLHVRPDPVTVQYATVIGLCVALVLSVWLNTRDRRRRRSS